MRTILNTFTKISLLIGSIALLFGCGSTITSEVVTSPNGKFEITVSTENETSSLQYAIKYNGEEVVHPSNLGFMLEDEKTIGAGLAIKNVEVATVDQSWKPLYGERNEYPEVYAESKIQMVSNETGDEVFTFNVRAYNEGIAFRYELPDNGKVVFWEELTEFALDNSAQAWATKMSQGSIAKMPVNEIKGRVERPLLVQLSESKFLAIGEAAQIDYPRMKLSSVDETSTLVSSLGGEVTKDGAFNTPWRFIMAGNSAGSILEKNYLILNLNEPNKLEDTSWIKPGKVIRDVTLTTAGSKACIDFAAENGLQYVIVSAGWYGDEFTTEADASTVTLDPKRSKGPMDLPEVIRYGKEKGIGIMLYINRNQMEKQLDEVLPLYEEWGIAGLKYGFVRTGDQKWSSWMHEAVRKAADHKMVLSIHDDYRPVGYTRTYPNLMTQEGIRGDEETPSNEHTIKTMFTRMLAGAGDNTICHFAPRVQTMGSATSQLAKSVCLYSPLLWLYWYDRPQGAPVNRGGAGTDKPSIILDVDEVEWYKNLPTVFDETKVIHSWVGVVGTIARRSGDDWFVGTVNGNTDRSLSIPLDFLSRGKQYEATIYYDNEKSDSPTKVSVEKIDVNNKTTLERDIFKNNGLAIHIYPKN